MSAVISRRQVLGILAAAACTRRGAWGADRGLYALTASTDQYAELRFPAVLVSLGADATSVSWAAELLTETQGVGHIRYSLEGGLIVVGEHSGFGGQAVVVRFEAPGRPRPLKLDLGGMFLGALHLVWFQGSLYLAVNLFLDGRFKLIGIRLDDLSSGELKPEQLYQDFAIDGDGGGLVPDSDRAYLEQPAGSRRLMFAEWPPPRFPSPFTLPPGVSFSLKALPELSAVNRELAVVSSRDTRVWNGMDGFTPVQLLDRQKGIWHSIEVPGAQSAFRAFGTWLAVHVRYNLKPKPRRDIPEVREDGQAPLKPSPGADRRRQGVSFTGPSFDSRAGDQQIYQPGLIFLYHVPSRRRIVEETGQGDTEVLLVEGDKVLYRCDRILYEARIDGTRLTDKRKLIERDFIADVHWVFYGPPSPPPPDPPWTAFSDNT
jgi:hypothetical protein